MPEHSSLAVVFATIDRPTVVQRLVRSIRDRFDTIPIHVGDQSQPTAAMQEFYDRHGVRVTWLPYDCGVTAARNAVIAGVDADHFLLCDDDFIMLPETDPAEALKIMRHEPGVGVVGGRLFDQWQDQHYSRYWELFLQHDHANRVLFSIPIYHAFPRAQHCGTTKYFLCDAVMNWALFRRSIFDGRIRWDERFKSNGEHEDFYLNFKQDGRHRVAYLPTLVARHHHPPSRGYKRLRERAAGWTLFLDKWDLEQMVEIGGPARAAPHVGHEPIGKTDKASFFLSRPLRRERDHNIRADAVDLDPVVGLVPRNLLDGEGNHDRGTAVRFGEVRLVGRAMVPTPPPAAAKPAVKAVTEPALGDPSSPLRLLYPAVFDQRGDNLLWLRAEDTRLALPELRAILTWSDGSGVVAEGPATTWSAVDSDCWSAAMAELPPLPQPGLYRFRLSVACGGRTRPVADGLAAVGLPGTEALSGIACLGRSVADATARERLPGLLRHSPALPGSAGSYRLLPLGNARHAVLQARLSGPGRGGPAWLVVRDPGGASWLAERLPAGQAEVAVALRLPPAWQAPGWEVGILGGGGWRRLVDTEAAAVLEDAGTAALPHAAE